MMERALERAGQIAQARQASVVDAAAVKIGDALPGASVKVEGTDVAVTGRGLLKRWLASAELRFLASALQ